MNTTTQLLDRLEGLVQDTSLHTAEIQQILEQLKQTLQADEPVSSQEDLIYVPMNPLVKEAKDLGGAESMAFGYNVLGTVAVNAFTQNTLALAIAGPVIEKVGFFFWEYIKAVQESKKTGKPVSQEFKANLSNGLKNLLVDIGVHDTIYTTLMAYGLSHQMFDARVLAIFSFLIALPPAILVKYSGNELLYHVQKQLTKLSGFEWEKYYEARFIFNNQTKPITIFEETANKFGLGDYHKSSYHDIYFNHRMPDFSDRTGSLKLREITDSATGNTVRNLEIAHTLAKKDYLSKNGIYNFFYSSKEKGKKDLLGKNPESLIKSFPYRTMIKAPSKEVSFEREVCYDNELRITLDTIIDPTNDDIKSVIELKAFKDTRYLMEAMQSIMKKENIRLTTQGKKDLL